jgi:hypothetical protein
MADANINDHSKEYMSAVEKAEAIERSYIREYRKK